MQLELGFVSFRPQPTGPPAEWLNVRGKKVLLNLIRNRRARRYVLRLRSDGVARVTIPRGGSSLEARRFAERNAAWLEKQLLRQAVDPGGAKPWPSGSEFFFRGRPVRLHAEVSGDIGIAGFGEERVRIKNPTGDLRPEVERHLWRLAARELPLRVLDLASRHQISVGRVTVRNQRSRWGSCSRRGTISLNWRLIQAPESVRDYIILHELAHLKEMNHSSRFWKEVARLCPNYQKEETWLKTNSKLLR
jgi:predicted metal-dependent hydrolase